MSDFVTLNCPSCGGKLNVQKNSPTYICEYCGTEHKLREEDIEYFGRCPKCHRNDRVEKITAIVNKHDPLAVRFPLPEQVNIDRLIGRPDLATKQKINLLPMQYSPINMNENKAKKYFLGMVVMLLLACVVISIISDTESDSFGLIVGVLFLGSFALAILGVVTHMIGEADRKEREKERLIKRSVLEKELLAQESDVKKQTANLKRKLMLRYNQIYYCHRDDLLFIPGEAGYASCNDYERFLTQGLKTIKRKE